MTDQKIKELQDKILKLKEKENALILAHFYVDTSIQEIADAVGDSLYLAKVAKEKGDDFDYIIEAAVYFMAETAVILNPEKEVYISGLETFCPMARMCPANIIDEFKLKYPDYPVVLYVNTTAEAKTRADVMCTSSNAVKICKSLNVSALLFGPDKNLGLWVKKESGIDIINVPQNGYCYVHNLFTLEVLKQKKAEHPNAIILAHPECKPEILEYADVVGSTKIMYDYCRNSKNTEFIIATEKGLIDRMNKEFGPEKKFYPALDKAICKSMKNNSLDGVLEILLKKPKIKRVTVEPQIAEKARIGIDKMFELMKN
ncbi:MAG: quinolinate synthase NadA [Candidatus Helarchaeota archaeon]